ncbi:hypothetical protein M378DRAFT_369369 [Amanita muscaria Koide BX008]|uniref:Uncharacterized protein n=1 Tax=Amanita muscaria (strain Koide BX008) TaxID=946122 RepID=A0A0C2XCJ6_AMAMK|nr:hypothetical protein M378DRAFT_369369 [Amanita muscaria Koide BX008]
MPTLHISQRRNISPDLDQLLVFIWYLALGQAVDKMTVTTAIAVRVHANRSTKANDSSVIQYFKYQPTKPRRPGLRSGNVQWRHISNVLQLHKDNRLGRGSDLMQVRYDRTCSNFKGIRRMLASFTW